MKDTLAPDDQPLIEALARYIVEMRSFVREPQPATLVRLDSAFAEVRKVQKEGWPRLAHAVDRVGLAACDVVAALQGSHARRPTDARLHLVTHDRALSRLVEALAPIAA